MTIPESSEKSKAISSAFLSKVGILAIGVMPGFVASIVPVFGQMFAAYAGFQIRKKSYESDFFLISLLTIGGLIGSYMAATLYSDSFLLSIPDLTSPMLLLTLSTPFIFIGFAGLYDLKIKFIGKERFWLND